MLILKKSWTGCWWFSLHACLIHPWRHHHHHLVSRLTADALCCSCSCSIMWSIPTKEMFFWRLRAVSSRIKGSHKFHSFLDKQQVLLVLCNYLLPFSNCFCFLKHERIDCSIEYLGDFYYHLLGYFGIKMYSSEMSCVCAILGRLYLGLYFL